MVQEAGLQSRVEVDSAGTIDFHTGSAPDPRTQRTAAARGIAMQQLRARQLRDDDYVRFDLLVAMGGEHEQVMRSAAPPEHQHKIRQFTSFSPRLPRGDVPDPYYGGAGGFDSVFDMVEIGARAVLDHVRAEFLAG